MLLPRGAPSWPMPDGSGLGVLKPSQRHRKYPERSTHGKRKGGTPPDPAPRGQQEGAQVWDQTELDPDPFTFQLSDLSKRSQRKSPGLRIPTGKPG